VWPAAEYSEPGCTWLGGVQGDNAPCRIGTAGPCFGVEAVVAAAGVMEDLARVGTVADERFARRLDVGDDEMKELSRAWGGRGDARAEDDRTGGAGGCELEQPAVALHDVRVTPPSAPDAHLVRNTVARRSQAV
jgi:hypothetical protein